MSTTSLSDISLPGRFRCTNVDCEGDAAIQLKRLGVCDGRSLEVMQPGDPMVLRVVGAQIGVSRMLASSVRVEPAAASANVDISHSKTATIDLVTGVTDSESKVVSHA